MMQNKFTDAAIRWNGVVTGTLLFVSVFSFAAAAPAGTLEAGFADPPDAMRPQTWFHLIGGNVSKPGLTADLEAIDAAGIDGIQLFHGSGRPWPNVTPQIETLSSSWDDMIAHVADETKRLGLQLTMQNCPGWAMSGGPWITPDNAMRHLIWSRTDIEGGRPVSIQLARPQPSREDWRDYRDVRVLAFPTPAGDAEKYLIPAEIRSNRPQLPWIELIRGQKDTRVTLKPDKTDPVWVDVVFESPVYLRSMELPPVELLMMQRHYDPDTAIRVQAVTDEGLAHGMRRRIPRASWQDRQPEMALVLAWPDAKAAAFRITFENNHPMELTQLRLSSAARVNDWRGQAAYALRSLERAGTPVQDAAAFIEIDAIEDITQHMAVDGKLTWEAPAGSWTVLRFGHVNTGAKNQPAPPEATGFECDKLSPAGADQHFDGYIGRLTKPGGAADGGRLKGMLIDSWECYTQTWTPAMETMFADRRGYALRPWLPALAGWVVEDHLTSERFLRDWRATISDLLVDNYFGRLAERASQRGMKLSFETAIGDVSPGDILQYYSKADIPMCEFWQPNDPHWAGLETKPVAPAVSAAHIYGKPRIAAEAFTNVNLKWNEHPFMLKHFADVHFARGVNHLVFHTYTHNPDRTVVPGTSFGGRIGTPFLRGQTWWPYMPLFTEYLSRCQYLLHQGRPVADVLWYLGDDLDHKPRQDSPFPEGYRFDYLNQDALLHRIDVVDGMLQTPEGVTWKVLWLPGDQCRRLTPETLERLGQLLQAGATVIGGPPLENASWVGGRPADKPYTARVARLWGDAPASAGDRRIGQGRLLWGSSLAATLSHLSIVPDVIGTRAATWCHRRDEGKEIYFIAADRNSPLDANLRFHAQGRPEFWDPMTGTIQTIGLYTRQDPYTVIPVQLPAAGSTFVVFRNEAATPRFMKIEHNGKTWLDASDRTKTETGEPSPVLGLTPGDPVQPWREPAPLKGTLIDAGDQFVAWQDGQYTFTRTNHKRFSATVAGTCAIPLNTGWTLSFPSGWDAPERVDLLQLAPWSDLENAAAKHFSGTAAYSKRFDMEGIQPDERYVLDLGRVAQIAEVSVNGETVASRWAPPFRVDMTPYLKAGSNQLVVRITNTWYNRLIYEAALPREKQKTWTINAPGADKEIEKAGLVGPVVLRIGKVIDLTSIDGKP